MRIQGRIHFRAVLVLALLASLPLAAWGFGEELEWNDAQIDWKSYDQGLEAARWAKKPICLVFYTSWCPHCRNYSGVFRDPKVVERSKRFVMVRVNADEFPAVSGQYAPDGEYIPRTFFLASDGRLDPSIQGRNPRSRYVYSERDPSSLLGAMEQALRKL